MTAFSIKKLSSLHQVEDFDCGEETLNRFLSSFFVGWVSLTKPFGYAATERSRSAGQRPTARVVVLGFAIGKPNLQLFITTSWVSPKMEQPPYCLIRGEKV